MGVSTLARLTEMREALDALDVIDRVSVSSTEIDVTLLQTQLKRFSFENLSRRIGSRRNGSRSCSLRSGSRSRSLEVSKYSRSAEIDASLMQAQCARLRNRWSGSRSCPLRSGNRSYSLEELENSRSAEIGAPLMQAQCAPPTNESRSSPVRSLRSHSLEVPNNSRSAEIGASLMRAQCAHLSNESRSRPLERSNKSRFWTQSETHHSGSIPLEGVATAPRGLAQIHVVCQRRGIVVGSNPYEVRDDSENTLNPLLDDLNEFNDLAEEVPVVPIEVRVKKSQWSRRRLRIILPQG